MAEGRWWYPVCRRCNQGRYRLCIRVVRSVSTCVVTSNVAVRVVVMVPVAWCGRGVARCVACSRWDVVGRLWPPRCGKVPSPASACPWRCQLRDTRRCRYVHVDSCVRVLVNRRLLWVRLTFQARPKVLVPAIPARFSRHVLDVRAVMALYCRVTMQCDVAGLAMPAIHGGTCYLVAVFSSFRVRTSRTCSRLSSQGVLHMLLTALDPTVLCDKIAPMALVVCNIRRELSQASSVCM